MAEGIKISALPAAESVAAEDVVAGVQNNTTKKFSLATILAYLQSAFTIGSGTKTALTGILKGNGTTVEVATVDAVPTANSTNPVQSGGVKSALSYASLGSFSTLAALGTLLDTALSGMSAQTQYNIRVTASATVAPFTINYVYSGTLIKASNDYASVLLEPMGQDNAILCRRSLADGWTYQSLATQDYANNLFALKEFAYFTPIAINGTTPTTVQLANDGSYLCVIIGNATQSQIMTVLVGSTGNVSHTFFGSNTAFTVEDGNSAPGAPLEARMLKITFNSTQIRYAYFYSLNGAAVPTVVP